MGKFKPSTPKPPQTRLELPRIHTNPTEIPVIDLTTPPSSVNLRFVEQGEGRARSTPGNDDNDLLETFVTSQESDLVMMSSDLLARIIDHVSAKLEFYQQELDSRRTQVQQSGSVHNATCYEPPPAPVYVPNPTQQQKNEIQETLALFGLSSLRALQFQAICAAIDHRDILILLPTGGGKSLCFQVPAIMAQYQVTFVFCPLVALILDQLKALLEVGIDAVRWGGNNADQGIVDQVTHAATRPRVVFLTPEKLHAGNTRDILRRLYMAGAINRFVVDEAQCIITWGREFRESYGLLDILRKDYADVPITALSGSATPKMIENIQSSLYFRPDRVILSQSYNRPNLRYSVIDREYKSEKARSQLSDYLCAIHHGHCGIVYCRGREACEKVASFLTTQGLNAHTFHSTLSPLDKETVLQIWNTSDKCVIVATGAFGMGMNKANGTSALNIRRNPLKMMTVRFVVHFDMPSSLESYYQETGRAGRDGQPADCVLFFHHSDYFKSMCLLNERDSPRVMLAYCLDMFTCRRVQILGQLGEAFDLTKCDRPCDNCEKRLGGCNTEILDLTDDGRIAVSLVQSIAQQHNKCTLTLCKIVLQGSRQAEVTNLDLHTNELHGALRHRGSDMIDLILWHLISREYLNLIEVKHGPHSKPYITVGSKADALLRGQDDFRVRSVVAKEKSKRTPVVVETRTPQPLFDDDESSERS